MGAKVYNTVCSQMVTKSGTDAAQQNLTSVIGREPFFSKKAQSFFIYKSLNVKFNTLI